MKSLATLCVALIAALSFTAPLVRAEDPPKPGETPKPATKEIVRLTEWPKPADKSQVLTDIERVCKAHIPEMAQQGHEGLLAEGGACVPFVLERYGRERDEAVQKRLFDVLLATTGAEHTRLLAKEFGSKYLPTRTFALWRAAQFPDPELRKDADAAWTRVSKQGDKADTEERYAAALCCASTGSIVGLPGLWDATNTPKEWDKKKNELRAALNGARGKEATAYVLAKLDDKADRKIKVCALRMLAACGDKDSAARVRPFLDDEDNQIRVAAINALRGIIDGDEPIENLSAFEAIELAKKWKSR
ncbi:MAG: HEAT repeat domain-containing protein [Planctomycetes bacterium]|nr:HEAT repeat domain-containing protein [Planctomycetota bacterium]